MKNAAVAASLIFFSPGNGATDTGVGAMDVFLGKKIGLIKALPPSLSRFILVKEGKFKNADWVPVFMEIIESQDPILTFEELMTHQMDYLTVAEQNRSPFRDVVSTILALIRFGQRESAFIVFVYGLGRMGYEIDPDIIPHKLGQNVYSVAVLEAYKCGIAVYEHILEVQMCLEYDKGILVSRKPYTIEDGPETTNAVPIGFLVPRIDRHPYEFISGFCNDVSTVMCLRPEKDITSAFEYGNRCMRHSMERVKEITDLDPNTLLLPRRQMRNTSCMIFSERTLLNVPLFFRDILAPHEFLNLSPRYFVYPDENQEDNPEEFVLEWNVIRSVFQGERGEQLKNMLGFIF